MASCVERSSVTTGVLRYTCSLTILSISTICLRKTGDGCTKSNRNLSGATSDPACFTWGPSTLRSAAWSKCVAV